MESATVGWDMKGQRDALESELNDAMVELIHTDFLLANFDLQTLFLYSLGKYYSEDVVLWFQDELTHGKISSFQRITEAVEFIHTFFEMGMATIETCRVTAVHEGPQGEFHTDWEVVCGEAHSKGRPHSLADDPSLERPTRHGRTTLQPAVGRLVGNDARKEQLNAGNLRN